MIESLHGTHEIIQYKENTTLRLYDNTEYEDYPPHWHTSLEIIMPLENIYTVDCYDQHFVLQENDMILIWPCCIHTLHAPQTGRRIIFQAEINTLRDIKQFSCLHNILAPINIVTPDTYPAIYSIIHNLVREIIEEYQTDSPFSTISIYSKLLTILTLLGRNTAQKAISFPAAEQKQKEYLDRFLYISEYISEHCTEDLNLNTIAALAGFSKFHFSRLFKQFTNVSFYRFLNEKRISIAENLLIDLDNSVTDVAIQSGFSNVSSFIRMFKQIKNCTPKQFRNMYYDNQMRGNSMNKISLFPLFQSGMVIQRNKPIHIWGSAPAQSCITVTMNETSVNTDTDINGSFHAVLPAKEAGTGHTLTITCNLPDTAPLILTDIAIGDVWLAGGQSNMEFFLRYDKDWNTVKTYTNNPQIRVYNVPQTAFEGHDRKAPGYGRWMQSNDPDFETFSAPGYSFALNLQPHLNIPIGIIGCNWGGTTATAWLDETLLASSPLDVYLKEYEEACSLYTPEEMKRLSMEGWQFEDSKEHDLEFRPLLYGRDYPWQLQYIAEHKNDPVIPMGPYNINRPGGLFHTMLEPLMSFPIKGAIWYQGESDSGHADIYHILMEKLISFWRQKWNDDLPFLFVQLAPFGVWLECTSDHYAIVRDKQELVSSTVPNTGMVSIMDIGSYYDIHPKEKMEVGRRLALLARGKVYGENILCESPRLISAKRNGNTITLTFNHCNILSTNGERNDFLITQNGNTLEITNLSIQENQIHITVKDSENDSITIELAHADYAEIHIFNEANLPVCPFTVTVS